MFEIGNSLREARLRQGLDLARVEDDTKIRAKYLQALEDERFELLPAETYVKGFLRTYAEYLGLDGQLYVDEFSSRYASAEEPVVSSPPRRKTRHRGTESGLVFLALAGIASIAILVIVAFAFSEDEPERGPSALGVAGTSTAASSPPAPPAQTATGGDGQTKPATARLVLAAVRGDCWVTVRKGAPNGDILYSGTIFRGDSVRFAARRLFLEFGDAPSENLNVRLNGKLVRSFPVGEPVVVVTPQGVRAQA